MYVLIFLKRLYVHPRKKAVAFETSCVYSVVYVYKKTEKVLLLTSDILQLLKMFRRWHVNFNWCLSCNVI